MENVLPADATRSVRSHMPSSDEILTCGSAPVVSYAMFSYTSSLTTRTRGWSRTMAAMPSSSAREKTLPVGF